MADGGTDEPRDLTNEELEALSAHLLAKAERARVDPVAFLDFVMEEETTREPIVAAPHQRLACHFILDHERCVIVLPPGFSKCHGRDTPILMFDGATKPVQDVRVGDRVMGADGKPRVVLATNRGRGELFVVTPHKAGHPFTVNEDHVLTLVNTDTGEVLDISVREYLSRSEWFRERHKLFHAPVDEFERKASIGMDPYFLGVWFGDGLHSIAPSRGVRVTTIEPEIVECLENTARDYGLQCVKRAKYEYALTLKKADRGRENTLKASIRFAVGRDLSLEKVKRAPREERAEFLAGFIDTDGGVVKNCVTLVQKRRDWAEAIAFIARSLGLAVSETIRTVPGYGSYVSLGIYGDWERSGVRPRVARKQFMARRGKRNALRSRFEVTPIGEGDFFGFTIGGDGRYLLGDFTVTHNSFLALGLSLWFLGHDATARGAIVSAAQEQSEKIVTAVRAYIEHSAKLHLVFPHLRPTQRDGEPWTQTKITVDRPAGIRDPSLSAYGLDSKSILGSRLKFAFVDDLLNDENTRTPEQREKIYRWLQNSVVSRKDKVGETHFALMNTAWHPDDAVQRSIREGWAALKMTVTGDIYVQDSQDRVVVARAAGVEFKPWDSDELRLADEYEPNPCRLVAHDPDPDNQVPLWPEVFDNVKIEEARRNNVPVIFNQLFMCECRDDATALCKQEFIDACYSTGRRLKVDGFTNRFRGPEPVFIGVDLAFEPGEEHDENCLFAFYPRRDGVRVIIDIDLGQWDGPTTLKKVVAMHDRFKNENNSVVITVESNGGQALLRQFALEKDRSLPIKSHTTTMAKAKPWSGIPGIFTELMNGAWAFPNDRHGQAHPNVRKLADACLYYTPQRHTSDVLMAMYFAWNQARKWGTLRQQSDASPEGRANARRRAGAIARVMQR
jgi:hypothetical protein